MASTFDTLSAAQDLESAGMDRKQAEVVTQIAASASAFGQDDLATKSDLESLRSTTKADLAAVEARLTWRLVIAAGVIVAAVKLIPGT